MKNCKNCKTETTESTICSKCSSPLHKDCAIVSNSSLYCDSCFIDLEDERVVDLDIVIPDVIRRSYIETYISCPYKFYMEVVKGMQSEASSFAQVGIDLHDLFEQGSKHLIKSPEEMKTIYKEIFDKYNDKMFENDLVLYKDMNVQGLKAKLWQQSVNSIDTFYAVLETLPYEAFALEERIEFSVGEDIPNLCITMDRIDENPDGSLDVRDWKTGTVMVGQKISTDMQAPLYIKAIKDKYGKHVKRFVFNYLGENKERIFEHVHGDEYVCTVGKREYKINITDAVKKTQSILAQIKNQEFNIPRNIKNMYFTCKTCGIQKLGACNGADEQAWKQYNKPKQTEGW